MGESRRQSEIRRGEPLRGGEGSRFKDSFRLDSSRKGEGKAESRTVFPHGPSGAAGPVPGSAPEPELLFGEPPVDYEPLVVPDLDPDPEEEVVYVLDEKGRPAFVRGDAEEEVVYLEEEEEEGEIEAPPAPARVRFPESAAEAVRRRAWREYISVLEERERAARREPARASRPGVRSWLELGGALFLVAGAGAVLRPDDPGFRRLDFNPFLLPILLFAVRFGTAHGALAGLASAAWVVATEGRFDVEEGSLILPGFLAAAGVFAGFLSRQQGRRLAAYRVRARALERERRRAIRALAAQEAVIRELRSRVEEYGVAPETLYRLCRAMSGDREEDLYAAVLEILSRDVGAVRAAVYEVAGGGRLDLRASRDARAVPAEFPPSLPDHEGLPGRVLREGRVVCRFEAGLRAAEAGTAAAPAILCGPIREGARIRAVVVVEELPLFEFGPATVARMEALLEWASEACTRAARRRDREESALFDAELGAYTPAYLADALAKEGGRAVRYGTPFSVLLVRLLGLHRMAPARRKAARRAVCRALAAHTREADSVCATGAEDTFAVILPMHEGIDVISLADRVNTAVGKAWPRSELRLSFAFADDDQCRALAGPAAEEAAA